MLKTIYITCSLLLLFNLAGNGQQEYISIFDNAKADHLRQEEGPSIDQLRATTLRLDPRALKSHRLPSHIRLSLFDDTVIDISLDDPHISPYKDMLVYRGRSTKAGYQHMDHYRDLVIIVNPHTQALSAQLHLAEGNYQITPAAGDGIYRVIQTSTDPLECHSDELLMADAKGVKLKNNDGCEERDADGRYVADLFVGYSYAAAVRVMDIDAHALSLVEMVNNGLTNSLVDNIYVRLVGAGLNPENPGVVTSVLSDVYDWYEEEIEATGADYIASVQVPTGGHKEAGGWAGVGGYSSVNSVNSAAAVFRHELGHNMGSSHCTPGIRPYAAGYNNGTSRTHMCGNNVNFYSTPLVMDDNGLPLGDAATADNARLWRERAPEASARRIHTIKYDEDELSCDAKTVDNGRYHIINVNSGMYLATDNGSNSRGTIVTQAAIPAPSNQWDLVNIESNRYRVNHVASGHNIDVPGSSSSPGVNMLIWSSHGGQNQLFNFAEVSTDTFEIKAFNGLCLQIKNIGTAAGDTIIQDLCDATDNNRWRLVPVAGGSDFNVVVTTTDVNCYGGATGSATATPSGGSGTYSYLWSDGQTTSRATGLASGTHTVSVSDGSESIPGSATIRQSAPMEVAASFVPGDIDNSGQATVVVSNGVMPLSYLWSNGETTSTATNLTTGLNSVLITDGNGCSHNKEVYVPCALLYSPCDDGNANTQGDHINESCNCVGEELVCGDELISTNVAIGKPATQSSSISGGIASRAVDGNPDGDWSNASVTHTDKEDNAWWELDLEQVYDVSAIVIWNRIDCCNRRLDSFYVFTSEVPFASIDLSTTIADPNVSSTFYPDAPLSNLIVKPTTALRYIRIQLAHEDRLHLAEVEVLVCGEVDTEILTANPLDGNRWEVKGNIWRQGRVITEVQLQYGEGDFSDSINIDIGDINATDVFQVNDVVDIGIVSSQHFRLKVTAGGLVYYSNTFSIEPGQTYCTPESGNTFWYKRFNKVEYNGNIYNDSGNVNYEDTTEIHWGQFEMDSTYEFSLSTPSSTWTNLYYVIYIDLNNDGDFEDYNEIVGTSDPMGQTTLVSITIPHQDVLVDTDLRMRILGHEGGDIGPCYTPVGNYKDFSLTITSGQCQGTGHIDLRYADSDGDGYGDPDVTAMANCNDDGYTTDNTDFNDDEIAAYPGAPELCDGIDNDGNGLIDDDASLGDDIMELQSQVLYTGIYTAVNTIKSSIDVIGAPASDVRFYVGQSVEIDPSFEMPSGAEFIVMIQEECTSAAVRSSDSNSH